EPPGRRYRAMAIGLAAAVVVLVIIDGAAPLWAPPLLRSLGWETAAEQPDPALLDRLYRIEAARNQDRQDAAKSATALQETAAQTASTIQQLDRRIAALEARPAAPAGEIAELRQQLAKLSTAVTDLTGRVAAAEKAATEKAPPAQSAADPTDSSLLLA